MRTSASLFDGDGLQLDHARVELVDMEAMAAVLPRGGTLLRDVLVDAVDVALDAPELLVDLLDGFGRVAIVAALNAAMDEPLEEVRAHR